MRHVLERARLSGRRKAVVALEPRQGTEEVGGLSAMIKVGDRVIATEKIGGIFFTHVPQGTHGVVTEDQGGWLTRYYRVDFDNGATESCSEKQIAKLNR